MTTLRFEIPGLPVAQPRARATTVGGHARMYEAKKEHPIHTFKAAARLAARESLPGNQCLTEPLRLSAQFVFARPKRLTRKKDPEGWLPMPDKPDIDNLLKALLDGLNEVVWVDDRQVFQVTDSSKWYGARGEAPRTIVMVTRLSDPLATRGER